MKQAYRKSIYFERLLPEMLRFVKDCGGWIEIFRPGEYIIHAFDAETITAFGLKFGFGDRRLFANASDYNWNAL